MHGTCCEMNMQVFGVMTTAVSQSPASLVLTASIIHIISGCYCFLLLGPQLHYNYEGLMLWSQVHNDYKAIKLRTQVCYYNDGL